MYAEIVAEDRDREIGPILFDVCVDLGVVPQQMDPATWDELRRAIALYGADPAPFEARHLDLADPAPPTAPDVGHVGPKTAGLIRGHSANGIPSPTGITYPPWPAPRPQFPVPACTGPPEPDN